MDAAQLAVQIYRLKRAGFRRQHGAWQRGPWRMAEDAPCQRLDR